MALSSSLLIGIDVSSEYALRRAYKSLSIAFDIAIRFVRPLLSIATPFMGNCNTKKYILQLQVVYGNL